MRKMTLRRTWYALVASLALAVTPATWGGTIVNTLGAGDTWDTADGVGIGRMDVGPPTGGETCWETPTYGECAKTADLFPRSIAWSFVAPSSVSTDGVDLAVVRHPMFATNHLRVSLRADDTAKPGAELTVVNVFGQMTPSPFFKTASLARAQFASPVALTSGATYWIMLEATETPVIWIYAPYDFGAGQCENGRVGAGMWLSTLTGAWTAFAEQNQMPGCSPAFRVTSP